MRTTKDNLWLDAPYETGAPLSGEHEADVAIVGGGYTGLAAAYFINQRSPGASVAILESDFIGFGSSGRNGGVVSGTLGNSVLPLKRIHGTEKTAQIEQLAHRSFTLTEELISKHGIDCDFEKNGRILVAENGKAVRLLQKEAGACQEVGVKAEWLEKDKTCKYSGGLGILAALYNPDEGLLNPVKFARGMKNVVKSVGVHVYEYSRCTHIEPGPVVSLYTPLGRIRAKAIVLATNAYSNPLNLFRHKVLPFYVYYIATERLTDKQMEEFKWLRRATMMNQKTIFWAMRLSADNRLLFIECDGLYFYDVDRDYSHRQCEYRSHYELMIRLFPFLKGIKMAYAWGGRVAMTVDFLPSVGCTGKHKNIYYSMGYNGHGLAFSQLAGKMLAELMAGQESELTDNPLINKSVWGVSSPPVMYLGINSYKAYLKMRDRILDFGA